MKMKSIYLDNAANTPLDKEVLKAMKPYLMPKFVGNSFATHDFGVKAAGAIEDARSSVAHLFHSKNEEVYFSSGATESNNWVIKSLALAELKKKEAGLPYKEHVICLSIEHNSVLNACKELQQLGFSVTFVKPRDNGRVLLQDFARHVTKKTFLVCCMAVNNETGILYPVDAISKLCKAKNKDLYFLSDFTQMISYGGRYLNLKEDFPNIDYFTFSAHKIYGPTGVGALIVKNNAPVYPLIIGGSQEDGKRGGTSNTAGIVGLGKACELLEGKDYRFYFKELYFYLMELLAQLGNSEYRNVELMPIDHYNIANISLHPIIDCENLSNLLANQGIAVSAGSACDTQHIQVFNPSHVLKALKLSEKEIRNTIRVSFSKYTTKKDIDALIAALKTIKNMQKGGKND